MKETYTVEVKLIVSDALRRRSKLASYMSTSDLPLLAVGIVLIVIAALGSPIQTYLYGKAFSKLSKLLLGEYQNESFIYDVRILCGAIMAVGLGRMIFTWLGILAWLLVGERVQIRARKNIFHSLLSRSVEWFDTKENLSGTMAQVNRCVEELRCGVSENLGLLVQTAASLAFLFATAMIALWSLTLVIMAAAPFMALSSLLFGKLTYKYASMENMRSAAASKVLDWCFSSGKEMRIFNGKHFDAVKFNRAVDLSARSFVQMSLAIAGNATTMKLLINIVLVLGCLFGKKMIDMGQIGVGLMFTAFSACLLLGSELSTLAETLAILQKAQASTSSIDTMGFAGQPPEVVQLGSPKLSCTSISMRAVSFQYITSVTAVIKNVDAYFDSSSLNFILGKSGSGKSTVALLLSGLLVPTLGSICVDEVEDRDLGPLWYSQNVTYLELNSTIFDQLLRKNLLLGCVSTTDDVLMEACQLAGLSDWVDLLPQKIDSMIKATSLSGGQLQKVGLARAFLRNSPILILDEATSAIDIASRGRIFSNVREKRHGKLTIVITHNPMEIKDHDQVLLFEDGAVKFSGRGSEVDLFEKFEEGEDYDDSSFEESEVSDKKQRFSVYDYLTNPAVLRDLEQPKEEELIPLSIFRILRLCYATTNNRILITVGLVFSFLCGLASPALSFCFAKLLAIVFDTVPSQPVSWVIATIGVALTEALFYFVSHVSLLYSLEMWIVALRKTCLATINDQDMSFFTTLYLSPSDLTTLLMNDTRDLRNLVSEFLPAALLAVSLSTLGIIWAIVVGWKLALVGLAFVPLVLLVTVAYGLILLKYETEYKSRVAELEAFGYNVVAGIRTVKSFGLADELRSDFDVNLNAIHSAGMKRALASGFGIALQELCTSVATGVILYYGMCLVARGNYSNAQMLEVLTLLMFTMASAGSLMHKFPEIARGQRAGTLISRILSYGALGVETDGDLIVVNYRSSPVLEATDVSFSYPDSTSKRYKAVLNNASFRIANEIVAIVGESGAGKSTIGLILARLVPRDRGSIMLFGKPISSYEPECFRSTVVLCPQSANFFEGTVYENLTYGLRPSTVSPEFVFECLEKCNALSFVEKLPCGVDTVIGEGTDTLLSLGQKQRLSLARALVRKPKVLILDEPTSNLDAENAEMITELLLGLQEVDSKLAIIIITHDALVMKRVPRLLVLSHGEVVQDGSYNDLVSERGELFRLLKQI